MNAEEQTKPNNTKESKSTTGKKRKVCHVSTKSTIDATSTRNSASNFTTKLPRQIMNPDFHELAEKYPDFALQWKNLKERQERNEGEKNKRNDNQVGIHNNNIVDNVSTNAMGKTNTSFSTYVDFNFNLALTRALLKENFELTLPVMPKGYLTPPIPNRLNYVLWIKELLRQTYHSQNDYFESHNHDDSHTFIFSPSYRGIDLGTGASCIYPLLLSTRYFDTNQQWKFLGTDIDPYSIQCAQQNVIANNLQDKIQVCLVSPTQMQGSQSSTSSPDSVNDQDSNKIYNGETPIHAAMKVASFMFHKPSDMIKDQQQSQQQQQRSNIHFDFCMTNPPFYPNVEEATIPRAGDERDRTDMTIFESVYPGQPGGEVSFVLDMINDSLLYKHDITWFSAMIGRKGSLVPIEKVLKKLGFGVGSIRKTDFVQGKGLRWGIAWTFYPPSMRSKVTELKGEIESFEVKFDKPMYRFDILDEISNRILMFCTSCYKGPRISCNRVDQHHIALIEYSNANHSNHGEEESKKKMVYTPCNLLIDFFVTVPCVDDDDDDDEYDSVSIKIQTYCHFKDARNRISNILNQVVSEVNRTNRRWRRRKQKNMKDSN